MPPGKGSGGLSPAVLVFLAIVLAAAVAIAVVVVVVSLNRSGSAHPSPTVAAEPTSAESSPETEETEETAEASDDDRLIQEGWQRASASKWGLVYEIPPRDEGWVFDNPTMIRGFEDDDGTVQVAMSGTSVYLEEPCQDWGNRAMLGAQGITDSDDTAAMSEAVALNWALHGFNTYGDPGRSVRSVEEFSANGLTGHHAIVDVTVPGGDGDCVPTDAIVHALAAPHRDGGSRIFLMLLDSGIDDAPSEDTVDTIISTLRDVDYEV